MAWLYEIHHADGMGLKGGKSVEAEGEEAGPRWAAWARTLSGRGSEGILESEEKSC